EDVFDLETDVAADAPRPLLDGLISAEHQAWLDGSYDQVVHTGDLWFGRLLEHLAGLGLEDRTLVVFTADHGEEFFEHGMFDHGQSLYPELVGVPLVLAGPGVEPGVERTEPVSNRWVFELLSAASQGSMGAGETLAGAGGPVFYSTRRGIWNGELAQTIHGVRHGRWSLHLAPGSSTWGATPGTQAEGASRLYDLELDPQELRDVAAEQPEVHAELRDLLLRRLASATERRRALGVTGIEGLDAGAATIEMLKDIGYL
ncbi:MAG: sulfatase-like hydrolase/transferase, partial [Planctomycetota bacterium]|nr:sulfatase-like hydrolase/transferase [Planctomycetota bacterium]